MFGVQFNAGASRDAIRKSLALMRDMTPVYQDVVEYMIQATRERFVTGIAPDGTKWAPKQQSTLDRYKRLGYGNLDRLLIGPGHRLAREVVGLANSQGAVIGSALIYSRVMQDGAQKGAFGTNARGRPIPWGRIPARTWLGISRDDEVKIIDIADEHLKKALDQKGTGQ